MKPTITTNPNVMHGSPCFAETRVEVRTFFDHLEAGYSVDDFLSQFPTVRKDQVSNFMSDLRNIAANIAIEA